MTNPEQGPASVIELPQCIHKLSVEIVKYRSADAHIRDYIVAGTSAS